jgi:transcriptional regulator with XRE-family HTH domain
MIGAELVTWDAIGGSLAHKPAASRPLAWAMLGAMTSVDPSPASLNAVERYLPQGTSPSGSLRLMVSHLREPASTPERIRDVLRFLGLTKTQLKDACRVSRQTLYDWLEGRFEPEAERAERLEHLHALALVAREAGGPLSAKVVERKLPDGKTLAALLCAARPRYDELKRIVAALAGATAGRKGRSARARLEQLGGRPPSRGAQEATLADNLDKLG